ncbi:MAG: glycosyltransferase N-terminal domain-containing protein [bacterium]
MGPLRTLVRAHLFGRPRPIWIRAVSVGEVTAILPLVRALAAPRADGTPGDRVVLSTVTVTANQTAAPRRPREPTSYICRSIWDSSRAVPFAPFARGCS